MIWNTSEILNALLGGSLIGLAASLMLFFNGRVTGISGIYNGIFRRISPDFSWRLAMVLGLIVGGAIAFNFRPDLFQNTSERGSWDLVVAGILVGFGTIMGSGCTSGHGICGLSRLSLRSLIATGSFMAFGFLSAFLYRLFFLGAA